MKVAIGADEAGYALKETIKAHFEAQGIQFVDFGLTDGEQSVDYPDIGFAVASAIARNEFERGILICGTGIGMAITADKVVGIRAALCHDNYSAERSRKSNNAQILTMGARVIGSELAKSVTTTWLNSEFEGGPSSRKIQKIMDGEKANKNNIMEGG